MVFRRGVLRLALVVALFVIAGGVVSAFRADDQQFGTEIEIVTGVLVPEPGVGNDKPSACIEQSPSCASSELISMSY